MAHDIVPDNENVPPFRQMLRNLMIEMLVYGVLLVGYLFIVLEYFSDPIRNLFEQNLPLYAVVGLGLIIVQAVLLEFITSILFDFLGLNRLTSK